MQFDAFHLIFLLVSLLAGGAVASVILHGRIALAEANGRAAGDVQLATLTEQLKSALQDAAQARQQGSLAEQAVNTLRPSLEAATTERAQFEERAARIPELEGRLNKFQTDTESLAEQIAGLRETNGKLSTDVIARQQQITRLDQTNTQLTSERESLTNELTTVKTIVARLTQELEAERLQTQQKLALLDQAKQTLSDQFKTLASEILDEKSKKFTEQNQTNIGQLLSPLKQQLTDFKAKVEEVYVNEGKDRSALTEQVKQLLTLNQTLSQDATNLTLALKGDRKAQGNWGEIILDDVLEKSGLLRGQHYDRQGSVKSEDGQTHVIPDVVIKLPGDRHLVVDSKFTLPDYRAFASADSEDDRAAALKRHLTAIRGHTKRLSESNYQALYGLKSLDFVLMFIPLEPAFMIAVTNDRELFQQAWDKNVLLVSPSTLLFVIRTVANLWRQEGLSRNAKEISNRGAELYDKLRGFVDELTKVGNAIEAARNSFDEAKRKLSIGKGNVIRQAEMLKELGVKPSKAIAAQWAESAMDQPLAALTNETTEELT
jgi:DNA recombination protein RmuC